MILVHTWWWFQHVTGMDNLSGRPYGFWSGFGSDITELALVGVLIKGITVLVSHHKEHMRELKLQRRYHGR